MAYIVEKAKILDIPELLEIAIQFWQETQTYSQRPLNLQKVKTQLQTLILLPTLGTVLIVKDQQGKILGGFVGGIQEEWMTDSLMAFDYCMFVRPECRGSRVAYLLIQAFIAWAKEQGCHFIQCGTATQINTEKTINFYKKIGFEHTGSFLELYL